MGHFNKKHCTFFANTKRTYTGTSKRPPNFVPFQLLLTAAYCKVILTKKIPAHQLDVFPWWKQMKYWTITANIKLTKPCHHEEPEGMNIACNVSSHYWSLTWECSNFVRDLQPIFSVSSHLLLSFASTLFPIGLHAKILFLYMLLRSLAKKYTGWSTSYATHSWRYICQKINYT
jgi:hypothetical protein